MKEVWIVCGGRDYNHEANLWRVLDGLCVTRGRPLKLIHGAARGADRLAGRWARCRYIEEIPVPANWTLLGNSAGPRRNQRMLDEFPPTVVIAFPGGTGTADIVHRAKDANVEVIQVP